MSFQYIAYRYDASSVAEPPKDSTARSTGLPGALEKALEGVSIFKTPANVGILGPQFAYRVMEADRQRYHVLSSVRGTKEEGTEATGHIAHHIILTEEEVEELGRNSAHPTPAGVILALEKNGIWQTEGPATPDTPLSFTAAALPDATGQATWEKITGGKGNSRALHHKDYVGRCIVMLPTPVDVRDALMLMHESDQPAPDHGWGHTFTTYGTEADTTEATQRIFLPIGSLTATNEAWAGIPHLCVNERMDLDGTDIPVGAVCAKTESIPNPRDRRVAPAKPAPYHYVEVDDSRMFHVPFRRISPLLRYGIGVCILLVVSAVVYALTSIGVEGQAHANKTATPPPTPAHHAHAKAPEKHHTLERQAVYPGQKLPKNLQEALTSPKAVLTLQPLTPNSPGIQGKVQTVETEGDRLSVNLKDGAGDLHSVVILVNGQNLADIRHRGKPAALSITVHHKQIALIPAIQLHLPELAQVRLPDIEFDLTPADLKPGHGQLRCLRLPPVAKTNVLPPTEHPFLLLPKVPDCRNTVICEPQKNVPLEMVAEAQPYKGGLQLFCLELKLCSPFCKHFTRHFHKVASLPLTEEIPSATMSSLFEMTRKMGEGDMDVFDPEFYENLRNATARQVRLPEFSTDKGFARDIEEALCDKINRDCQDLYEHTRVEAEAYREPLVLELRSVRFNEHGNGLNWKFELRPEKKEDKTAP